jgi:hypothetical protein
MSGMTQKPRISLRMVPIKKKKKEQSMGYSIFQLPVGAGQTNSKSLQKYPLHHSKAQHPMTALFHIAN